MTGYRIFHLAATSVLLLVAHHHQPSIFANAASADKENEVKSIYEWMESQALRFRDEMERVYAARCETQTLKECYKMNYNDCSSTFPNQVCMKADELVIATCGDGTSCNGKVLFV